MQGCKCHSIKVYLKMTIYFSIFKSRLDITRTNIQQCAYHCTTFRPSASNHKPSAVSGPPLTHSPHGQPSIRKPPICVDEHLIPSSPVLSAYGQFRYFDTISVFMLLCSKGGCKFFIDSLQHIRPITLMFILKSQTSAEVYFPSTHRRLVAIIKAPAPHAVIHTQMHCI